MESLRTAKHTRHSFTPTIRTCCNSTRSPIAIEACVAVTAEAAKSVSAGGVSSTIVRLCGTFVDIYTRLPVAIEAFFAVTAEAAKSVSAGGASSTSLYVFTFVDICTRLPVATEACVACTGEAVNSVCAGGASSAIVRLVGAFVVIYKRSSFNQSYVASATAVSE